MYSVNNLVKFVKAGENKTGVLGVIKEVKDNHNYVVAFNDGKTWNNVAYSSLELVSTNPEVGTEVVVTIGDNELKGVVKENDFASEAIVLDVNGSILETLKSKVKVTKSAEELKYPYSGQKLANPQHVIAIGDSTLSYTIADKRITYRVDGARLPISELIKVLKADEDFTSQTSLVKKSPYKIVKTDANDEGIAWIHREFLNVKKDMEESESLGLRFKEDDETLYGYQKNYIPDLMEALTQLGYAKADGDDYEFVLSRKLLESEGYTVPTGYDA